MSEQRASRLVIFQARFDPSREASGRPIAVTGVQEALEYPRRMAPGGDRIVLAEPLREPLPLHEHTLSWHADWTILLHDVAGSLRLAEPPFVRLELDPGLFLPHSAPVQGHSRGHTFLDDLSPMRGMLPVVRLASPHARLPIALPAVSSLGGQQHLAQALSSEFFVGQVLWLGALRLELAAVPEPVAIRHLHVSQLDSALPARLLIVHDGDPYAAGELLRVAERSAWHALLALPRAPEHQLAEFLRHFYRKLFHAWPLDQCVAFAARQVGLPVPLLVLRPGGETDLLLPRIVAEEAGTLHRGDDLLDEYADLRLPDHADWRLTRPTTRHERARLALNRHLSAQQAPLLAAAADLSQLEFLSEGVEVAQLMDARSRLRTMAPRAEVQRHLAASERSGPPSRVTRAWLELQGRSAAQPLPLGANVDLCVQIAFGSPPGVFSAEFPEQKLRELLTEADGEVELDVTAFFDPEDWVGQRQATLRLPLQGESPICRLTLSPLRAGKLELRLCIYYRNVLLQSIKLLAPAATAASEGQGAPEFSLDYFTTTDFQLLQDWDERVPHTSIFINDSGHSHHLGVRGADGSSWSLRLSADDLRLLADEARSALTQMHDDGDEQALLQLARVGREHLVKVLSRPGAPAPRSLPPGVVVRIDRVDAKACLPWSILYDYPLQVDRDDLRLCPHPEQCLQALRGRGASAGPAPSRGQPSCGEDDMVVCPSGFWGLRHIVEQPLGSSSFPIDRNAQAVADSNAHNQPQRSAGAFHGYAIEIDDAVAHAAAVQQALRGFAPIACESDGTKIQQHLSQGSASLYYLLCHGRPSQQRGRKFLLALPGPHLEGISAPGLLASRVARQTPFVAILNACDSAAMKPDVLNDFLSALACLGAVSIVGTEIEVKRAFAMKFGEELLAALAAGTAIGEALRSLRVEYMATARDASALLYSVYGSSDVSFT